MTVGPFFDQVQTGQVLAGAPSMTLTPGLAAVHQSILGNRLRPRNARQTANGYRRKADRTLRSTNEILIFMGGSAISTLRR